MLGVTTLGFAVKGIIMENKNIKRALVFALILGIVGALVMPIVSLYCVKIYSTYVYAGFGFISLSLIYVLKALYKKPK